MVSLAAVRLFEFDGQHLKLVNPRLTERLASYFEREWCKRPLL